MKTKAKKWSMFALRWGIAVLGVFLVVRKMTFRDHIMILSPESGVAEVQVLGNAKDSDSTFTIVAPGKPGDSPRSMIIPRDAVWAKPDRSRIAIQTAGGANDPRLLAVHPDPLNPRAGPTAFLIQDSGGAVSQILPSQVQDLHGYLKDYIPYPVVEVGLVRMVREADLRYLILAISVIPISLTLTTYRWHLLLEAVGIHIGMARTFATNMVGLFYNTFMPGSTGGDLVKAWYAAKHTTHRTWAVISVFIDRAIGLLALVILGGAMAAIQWSRIPACRNVAVVSGLMLGATAAGLCTFYIPMLRRRTGFDFLLQRLPMQRQVRNIVQGLEMYGHDHPAKTLLALGLCFPVHATTIVSAMLAGHAFGLTLPPLYYWVIVPVIALVGAIPLFPQGAGVMEAFAILLTRSQGVTISQAVALTMGIRLAQIFWNLVAGLFVLRGGYHAPTESEQHQLEEDEPETAALPTTLQFRSDAGGKASTALSI